MDDERYIETWQLLRPDTAAQVQAAYDRFQFGKTDGDVGMTIGSTEYERRGGKWYRQRRKKDPRYWDQPNYFFIAPGPGSQAFIAVKMPRRLSTQLWRRACGQLYRDATGRSWYSDRPVVDGADEDVYKKCVAGTMPEPAYEIMLDGSWKRTSPVTESVRQRAQRLVEALV